MLQRSCSTCMYYFQPEVKVSKCKSNESTDEYYYHTDSIHFYTTVYHKAYIDHFDIFLFCFFFIRHILAKPFCFSIIFIFGYRFIEDYYAAASRSRPSSTTATTGYDMQGTTYTHIKDNQTNFSSSS